MDKDSPMTNQGDMAMLDKLAAHVAAGGKAVGFAGTPFPVELVEALGLMAVPLLELGRARDADIEAEWIDDKEDPDVRSVFVRAMRGDLSGLSGIVSTRATDHVHYYLREVTRRGAWPDAVPLHILDLMPLKGEGVAAYNRGGVGKLAGFLERVSGRTLDPAVLEAIVTASNEKRARLREAARQVAEDAQGKRLMLVASAPLTSPLLQAAAETAGWSVVAVEDGSARLNPGPDLELGSDPLDAIADHYTALPSAQAHPRADRTAFIDQRLAEGGVDGVLFWMHRGDLRLGWDFPPLRNRIEALGIPVAMIHADLESEAGQQAVRDAAAGLIARA